MKCFFILLILLSAFESKAQKKGQAKIDSLIAALPAMKEDSNKSKLLNKISDAYLQLNPALSLKYTTDAMECAEKIGWKRGISQSNNMLAYIYYNKAEYDKAREYAILSLKQSEAIGNKTGVLNNVHVLAGIYTKKGDIKEAEAYSLLDLKLSEDSKDPLYIGPAQVQLGQLYGKTDNYPKATEYFFKALKTFEDTGDKSAVAATLSNIGGLYFKEGEARADLTLLLKAREFVLSALKINEAAGNKRYMAVNLKLLSQMSALQEDYPNALEYGQRALKINQELGNQESTGFSLSNLALIYQKTKDYHLAASYLFAAIEVKKQNASTQNTINDLMNLGALYMTIGKDTGFTYNADDTLIPPTRLATLQKAAGYLNSAIEKARDDHSILKNRMVLNNLSDVEEQLGDYRAANKAYAEYIRYKDSVFTLEKEKEVTRHELKYEFSKREDSLRFQQQLTDQQLREQTLLATQRNQALKLNQQQLLLANKAKDLERLAYLKTQADLQTEHVKSGESAKALIIIDKERQLQATTLKLQQSQLLLKDKDLHAKKAQQTMMLAGGALLLLFGGISFRRFRKQKMLENRQALLNERLRISRDLHDDMGATLSSISVYSTAVKQRLHDERIEEASDLLDTISEDAREMVGNMSDMVWMINPQQDTMEKLFDRMQQYAGNTFAARNIVLHFSADEALKASALSMDARKNLFLIFKEAINNAAKYAGCTEVKAQIMKRNDQLLMTITDNGLGFDAAAASAAGNGLRNMKQRAEELQGALAIDSGTGLGTTISFSGPLPIIGG